MASGMCGGGGAHEYGREGKSAGGGQIACPALCCCCEVWNSNTHDYGERKCVCPSTPPLPTHQGRPPTKTRYLSPIVRACRGVSREPSAGQNVRTNFEYPLPIPSGKRNAARGGYQKRAFPPPVAARRALQFRPLLRGVKKAGRGEALNPWPWKRNPETLNPKP